MEVANSRGAADTFESAAMIVDTSSMQRELKFKVDTYEARDTGPRRPISRTADMHALEKSDCAVVLVKQPNNGGQPFTEAVEGRTQAKDRGYSADYNVRDM